jgi:predicted dehydrogenase
MNDRPVGVGVIGCGEIAQLMHLPYIHELPQFEIAAVYDLSSKLVEQVGTLYGVSARYTDHRELLVNPAVEAVVICTFDHGEIVADTIAAGKHFIVEKPVAFTPGEAAHFVEEAAKSKLVAMVGYMRLFDPGYEIGIERIKAIGQPTAVRVHDFAGRFDRTRNLYTQFKRSDVPAAVLQEGRKRIYRRIEAALGPEHAGYRCLYFTILMLGSHDLAALRGVLGSPTGVANSRSCGPDHILALLDYADGPPAVFEIAFGAQYEWWDQVIEVKTLTEEVRIEFQNPYLRQHPALVRIRQADGDQASTRLLPGSADSAFRREWRHFAAAIRSGLPPRSSLEEGISDLLLAMEMVKALPPKRLERIS